MSELASKMTSAITELDPTRVTTAIFSLVLKIHEQYSEMKNNKEICQDLKRKVDMINGIVEKLSEIKQTGVCQRTLVELNECLSQCLVVISSIGAEKDTFGKIKDFLSAKGNKSVLVRLTTQLDSIAAILNLALTAQTANLVQQIAKKESENLPAIQQCKTQINEDVSQLKTEIHSITITNKVEFNLGGVHLPQVQASLPSYRSSVSLVEKLRDIKEKSKSEQDKFVLRELSQLFLDNRGERTAGKKHEKTSNFAVYNEVLERHNARLAYDSIDRIHILYVDYEPVSPKKEVLKKIKAMMDALTSSVFDPAASNSPYALTNAEDGSFFPNRRISHIPKSSSENKQEAEAEDMLNILEALHNMFLEKREKGQQSKNFPRYNGCLKKITQNTAKLIYIDEEQKHVLWMNGEKLSSEAAADVIWKMIKGLEKQEKKDDSACFMLSQYNQTPRPLFSVNTPNLKVVKDFLTLVVEGEQNKAEAMLKINPALALSSGDVTDLSNRMFKGITGFQYAVWALDWHMWKMIKQYLSDEAVQEQAKGFEIGSWVKDYDIHAEWLLNDLITSYQTCLDLYKSAKYDDCNNEWVKKVGNAQRLLPVHVVNEYCNPTRPFYPVPKFEENLVLSRTRAIAEGEWFTTSYKGGKLGVGFAIHRGKHAMAATKAWWSSLTGSAVTEIEADKNSVIKLTDCRVVQRNELIAKLKLIVQRKTSDLGALESA